jgi:transcriptional regulator with GAF, ATPase, and Fis domain
MRPVLEIIARVGPSDANVLITGENGTGKGVVAQALHAVSVRAGKPSSRSTWAASPRASSRASSSAMSAAPSPTRRSDRAGRFELADSGTLFMDEIGNIPLSQQAKILRTIETGEFERVGSSRTSRANVRLVSATNADLPPRSPPANSARISSSGSTRSTSTSRRSASAARTSNCSRSIF